jgi:MinD superfamily P-loop ATPase
MKQITIISGKGGTGKTTLASSFIKLSREQVAVYCDVDAANLHIMLSPRMKEKSDFIGGAIAHISEECIACGKCEELCRFDAIKDSTSDIVIDPLMCEGCGVCQEVCPAAAVELESEKQGEYYISDTDFCPMVHARLDPGAENSGLLVARIRNIAEDIAVENNKKAIIIDGAPGIGCPVIASLNGVDYAIIVTEPTLSGISDFKKAHEVTKFFNIETFACINKADINSRNSKIISDYCRNNGLVMLGEIPYDERVPKALSQKKFITDVSESPAGRKIIEFWTMIEKRIYA